VVHGEPADHPGFEPPPRLPLDALACGAPTPEPAVRVAALCSDSGLAGHCPAPGPAHGHYLVTLGHGGEQLGLLLLPTPPHGEPGAHHLETLRQIGEQIGLAISSDRVHRALTEARRNAEGTARAKSEFLASMSHEIRTPMHGVLGMLELIGNTALTEEQREYVDTARSSADSLLNLINDILDFTKIEAGRIELAQLEFDPALLVEEVTALLARSQSASGLEVACHIPAPLPTLVRGDPFRLRQVLTNLVGNAVKFTEAGEVVVRAEAEAATEDGIRLRFTIRDTGIGIDTATRERLFQVFYQADSTDTRRYGGTGLGLAISRQLVELMGGEIGVDSRPGLGSTFWFSVRLGRVAEEGRPQLAELAGLRALVVDDNATNRLILRDYLRHMGLQAVECGDGGTALEKLGAAAEAGNPLPVALLDLQMPGMDGLELARRIRADARLARTTLVLLSSVTPGDSERAGIDAWLMKPVRQGQLQDALLTVLRHDRPARPDPGAGAKNLSGRILLVEDNPVNQKVARSMLRKLGLDAEVAANGRAAMQRVASDRYDVILMDCQMPEMDGFEATTAIRRLEQERGLPRTPVIAMTAAALAGDRDRCLDAGMDDFLSKPVKLGVLREAVMRWLPDAGAREPVHNSE
ncbi:MAG: response regulator, partial [Gammaproteobacteria bacterium]|nr:response regulator [Gammaproteobacteria bacterium]